MWVSLQIQILCIRNKIKHEEDVYRQLDELPESLEKSYDVIVAQMQNPGPASFSQQTAQKCIQWLLCAQRPLTARELIAAVSVDSDGRPFMVSNDNLLDFCCNLIILDDEFDSKGREEIDGQGRRYNSEKGEEDAVFRFIHVSVREYFERPTKVEYQESRNHSLVLERCLCLYTLARGSEPYTQILLNYATQFWPVHLRCLSNQPLEIEIKERIKKFFHRGRYISPSFEMWANDAYQLSPSLPAPFRYMLRNVVSKPLTPLLLGCCFGILPIIHEIGVLNGMDTNWNQASEEGHASLCLAARFGYAATVKVLLENGASPDIRLQHKARRTPLLWAAFNGHENVMHVLLDREVDVNAKDGSNQTALQFFVIHRCDAAISTLLELGADASSRDNDEKTPLSWAAWNGYNTIVILLLQQRVDINGLDNNGKTPLSWAAGHGHNTTIQILLN